MDPIHLKHRIVMAPLTRLRSNNDGVVSDIVKTYYGQRATDGGLIISEATYTSPTGKGTEGAPGICTEEQVEAWKDVTDAVHEKGGKIFLQLWHCGRVSHSLIQPKGQLPVSSSAKAAIDIVNKRGAHTKEGRKDFEVPRALEIDEISKIVEEYKLAGKNALHAGFDGVEVHAANGYLLEQFLCDGVNERSDKYGGSLENRSRLLLEVLAAVLEEVPSSRLGVRLSPYGHTFGCTDSNPAEIYGYVVRKLCNLNLAYLHLIEPRGYHHTTPLVPEGGVVKLFRTMYTGVLAAASGFDAEQAEVVVESGIADLVAFGRSFITNPDLVKRLKEKLPLAPSTDSTFFYTGNEKGYIDYPQRESWLQSVKAIGSPT